MVEMTEASQHPAQRNGAQASSGCTINKAVATSTFRRPVTRLGPWARHIATRLKILHAVRNALLRTHNSRYRGGRLCNVQLGRDRARRRNRVPARGERRAPPTVVYGLQVAQSGRCPTAKSITQARHYLETLESQARPAHRRRIRRRSPAAAQRELATLRGSARHRLRRGPAPADPLRVAVEAIDPDELSPKAGS